MPTYQDWNSAIAKHFSEDLLPGASFYLSVDDDTLADIGELNFGDVGVDDYVDDFVAAVRGWCVYGSGGNRRVGINIVKGFSPDGLPNCIAFLSATVLAAYRMVADSDIAGTNYFTRLSELFDVPSNATGRPMGLNTGYEEDLWLIFNLWAFGNGWLPSARAGYGNMTYTNYPISQALLRGGDKERLEEAFRNQRLYNRDREQIYAWFIWRGGDLNAQHLRNLSEAAGNPDDDRANAILDAVYEVYTHTDWNAPAQFDQTSGSRAARATRRVSRAPTQLSAGLYREEDPIWGTVDYWLYPRMPDHRVGGDLRVVENGNSHPLQQDRDNRFRPLWLIDSFEGDAYAVEGGEREMKLVLPQREFWILTQDPYDESSGVFASWGSPNIGDKFLILCRNSYSYQLESLKRENLIEWDDAATLEYDPDWTEYRGCRIISTRWTGARDSDIFNELRPKSSASISSIGGLRSGRRRDEWMQGYLPQIVVSASGDTKIQLVNVNYPNEPIMDSDAVSGEPVALPDLEPGTYAIEATVSGRRAAIRNFRVASWDALQADAPNQSYHTQIGDRALNGALLANPKPSQPV